MRRFYLILFFLSLVAQVGDVCSQSVYWRQIFGGEYVDIAYNCIELRDGNYMMAGYKEIQVPGQIYQIPKSYIVKFDRYGNILWEKFIGDSSTYNISISLAEDPDGNIYLPYNSSHAHLVKLNSNGDMIWDKNFSSSNIILFSGLSFVEEYQKIILIGINITNGFPTSSITKLDSNGTLIWNKSNYDSLGILGTYNSGNNSFLFSDNEYFLSGFAQSAPGVQNRIGFILKTDTSGNILWNKKYSNSKGIYSIVKNSLNTFIASGQGNSALYCQSFDSMGNILWIRDYNGDSLAGSIGIQKIIKTKSNEFALGTPKGQNFGRLMKIDSLGNILESNFYPYPPNVGINQNNLNSTSDSGFIVSGYIRYFFSNRNESVFKENLDLKVEGDKDIDILVYKIDKYGQTVFIVNNEIQNTQPESFVLSQNFPNPFNPVTTISFSLPQASYVVLKVFDAAGKEIKELINEYRQRGSYEVKFDGSDLPSGIYFYRLAADDFTAVRRMILLK
ncbi:MAG: T9SS type A sorting domain-containing protein [Ignavibacteria bacterium]|nr:T9SS type A sorting domain-containing protein [Ignavibacteria bacterium]